MPIDILCLLPINSLCLLEKIFYDIPEIQNIHIFTELYLWPSHGHFNKLDFMQNM